MPNHQHIQWRQTSQRQDQRRGFVKITQHGIRLDDPDEKPLYRDAQKPRPFLASPLLESRISDLDGLVFKFLCTSPSRYGRRAPSHKGFSVDSFFDFVDAKCLIEILGIQYPETELEKYLEKLEMYRAFAGGGAFFDRGGDGHGER